MNITPFPLAGLFAIVLLSGCMSRPEPAPEPTLADRIESSAQVFADEAAARLVYADRWRQGDQMAKAGARQQKDAAAALKKAEKDQTRAEKELKKQQDRLAKAEKALAEAKDSQAAGKQKAAEGERLKAEAEAEFHTAYPGALLDH